VKSKLDNRPHRVDLNLLVVFEAIYKSRNLTAAGRTLGLSQPAMSHALGRLRTLFRDPLFVRLPRGLQPTPVADDLAPAVIEGLRGIRGGLERPTFDPRTSTRVFRIAMGDVAEWVHLPQIFSSVRASAPHVRLHTTQIPGPMLRDTLGDGRVDLATGDYDLGSRCRSILLYESAYACVLRADHPDIRSSISLKQFKAAEHVVVFPDSAFHHGQTVERAFDKHGIDDRIAVQIAHFHAVIPLVTSSNLIATIPARLAQAMQRFVPIRVVPPPVSLPRIRVYLYWHERFHRDPGNEWLRGLYVSLLRK
jgi:DNA-binding transcriptional LysR family regulator